MGERREGLGRVCESQKSRSGLGGKEVGDERRELQGSCEVASKIEKV